MQEKINRLRWQCRRGMLELDLLLLPFFDQYYTRLNQDNKQLFEHLLAYSDVELYQILIKRVPVSSHPLQLLIEGILGGN